MNHSINELIQTGDWLQCSTKTYDGDIIFRIRTLSFGKMNDNEIDRSKIKKLDEGILWILKIEIVNFTKNPLPAYHIRDKIKLLDQDNFMFDAIQDHYLTYDSIYATKNGLCRFISISGTPSLPCKMKTEGSLAFLLPDDELEFYLSIEDGDTVLL